MGSSMVRNRTPDHISGCLGTIPLNNAIWKVALTGIVAYTNGERCVRTWTKCNDIAVTFRHSCLSVFAWRRVVLHLFDPKTIVGSFLYLMVLFYKVDKTCLFSYLIYLLFSFVATSLSWMLFLIVINRWHRKPNW